MAAICKELANWIREITSNFKLLTDNQNFMQWKSDKAITNLGKVGECSKQTAQLMHDMTSSHVTVA